MGPKVAGEVGGETLRERSVVFVSYSRQDAKSRDKFLLMLAPDMRERRLDVWSDQREVVGYEWRPQLVDAIARSWAAHRGSSCLSGM